MPHFQELLDGERKIEEMRRVVLKAPPKLTVELVKRLYWFEELSCNQIAVRTDCTRANVWQFMVRHDIPRRPHKRPRYRGVKCQLCAAPVCMFKDYRIRTGSPWKKATLCLKHFIERARKQRREAALRFYGKRRQRNFVKLRGARQRPLQLNWVREW